MAARTETNTAPNEREALLSTLAVEPWADPVVDQLGHDPRSDYAARYWLAILGPSTLWLLRHLADRLEEQPEGFDLDLAAAAACIGVGMRGGRNSPFMRSVQRACRFGTARYVRADILAVRRKLPPLTRRQAERLPERLRDEHRALTERAAEPVDPAALRDRARRLALSLLELGEDVAATERQLHRWRFHPAMAHDALRWATERHAATAAAGSAYAGKVAATGSGPGSPSR